MRTEADRLRFVRLRPITTVRARTVLGGSLALGVALILSLSTAGGLLRRSLIRSIDEVAEVRAAEVAVLPTGAALPEGLASDGGEIVQVVSKAEILEHVWDYAFEGDPNIVEVYIRHLRKRIDEPFGRNAIQTVRLVGYRLDADGG